MVVLSRDRLETALSLINDPQSDGRVVFTRVYEDSARAEADAADGRAKAGQSRGPLDGVIISVKDLFDVAGDVTTAGSSVLKNTRAATEDAPPIAALRAAGAVIIGKTNMTEFAFSGIGINPHYGTPGNGANKRHVPGGSSAGAGVSVVEGTSRISIGSDTGGSTRIPAAFNGCVGFKPTASRITRAGAYPLSTTLDSIGPLAQTVADCALADAIMAGLLPQELRPMALRGRTLAIPRGRLLQDCEPEVEKAFQRAIAVLEKAGSHIVDTDIEPLLDRLAAVQAAPLVGVEAYAHHRDMLAERGKDYDPRVRQRLMASANVAAADYIHFLEQRRLLIAQMDAHLSAFDALILPTTPIRAPRILDMAQDDAFFAANAKALRNPCIANLFDLCAISLPCPDAGGLPVGLMLMGRHGADAALLALAAGVEAALQ